MTLLLGAGGVATSGCAHAPRPIPVEPAPVVFGWRLVPGQEFTYKVTTRLREGEDEMVREEHWRYLVREVDGHGAATIEGSLSGFGAVARLRGEELPRTAVDQLAEEEVERLSTARVRFGLSMDGRLEWLEGLDWADSLPHRLFALALPEGAVEPGAIWSDPAGVRPFGGGYPGSVELQVEGEHRLEGLHTLSDELRAEIHTVGALRPQVALVPGVSVEGVGLWSLERGVLLWRSLSVEVVDPERGREEVAVQLDVELELLP